MNALPPPLDNIYVLIAVIIGLLIMVYGLMQSRKASRRLDEARKEKARVIREAKLKAQNTKPNTKPK